MNHRLLAKASIIALGIAAAPTAALAQGAFDSLRDEVLVTATKKADAENVQDVPLAVTAYGAEQLDALKVRDLGNLSYSMPNVQLEDVGTTRGVANFSIRGLGINSSIPSIDPAVGVFVDGVYLGQTGGTVLDIFDLESVEVLRGPQGILFGRNVTGGAVLLNTKRPNLQEAEASFKGAVESGLRGTGNNYYAMGGFSAPLIKDKLAARISVYYNNDRGWHKRYLGGPNIQANVNAIGGGVAIFDNGIVVPGVNPLGLMFNIATNQPDAFVDFGKAETWMIRPSILWRPTDNVELLIKYEHGDSSGDGPASQNHSGFLPSFDTIGGVQVPPTPISNPFFSAPKDSFIFSIDEPGLYEFVWDAVTAELDIDVAFGDGTITNIFGWRDTSAATVSDIDATPLFLFHATTDSGFEQFSNELRYAGRFFDRLDATVGFYYFNSDQFYEEKRFILGGLRRLQGGGLLDTRQYGVFGQLEFDLTEAFSLIAGARYTNEKRDAVLVNLGLNNFPSTGGFVGPLCSVVAGTCLGSPNPVAPFTGSDKWTNVTPKFGATWSPREDLNLYAHWTEGVRSGGFNLRNTGTVNPALFFNAFDEETVRTIEAGLKAQPLDGRVQINAAAFRTKIDDMQRELNLPDPVAGVNQFIRNTADATILGFEVEAQIFLTEDLLLTGNVGHLDGDYDSVNLNLNSDFIDNVTGTATTTGQFNPPGDTEIIDARDLALLIPRLAPWTYGAGFVHNLDLSGETSVTTRFNYSHRDDNAFTDNNLGILQGADIIDASVALNLGRATLSIYGQNLLNEVTHGGETQLTTGIGAGSFAPLNKGRIAGVELQVGF